MDFSKRLIYDIRLLLWVITLAGIVLAFYCVHKEYLGSLPWITGLVGLPWSAHGVVCSFYLNMSKSDHKQGGITYELALKDAELSYPQPEDSTIINEYADTEDLSGRDFNSIDLFGPV